MQELHANTRGKTCLRRDPRTSPDRRARRRAAELGVSLAEYVRRLVRQDLGGSGRKADVSSLFALGDSGGSDVARQEDGYIGEADSGDRGHERAREVLSGDEPLLTSDHVLVETWTLLRHRLGREAAERWWSAVREGAALVESVGPADLEVAWGIGEAFADQDFSIVDRTSFAVMQRLGLHRAATLDRDFAVFRYGPRRDRAFEVLP